MIYLDSAATTPILPAALATFTAISRIPSNPNSAHKVGESAHETLENIKSVIAKCINAHPDEIHFTPSATTACQWAMETLSQNCASTQVSAVEHHAVLDFHVRINESLTRVGIAQMLANNETGEIFTPERGNKTDLLFTDATAAMGHIPIDVKKLDVDYLAAGAHKFGGPCGVGFLYAKRGAPLAEQNYGTPPVALIASMAAALEWQCENMDENRKILLRNFNIMEEKLRNIYYTRYNTPVFNPERPVLPHILNVSFDGVDGKALALLCSKRGVMISAGAACTSGNNDPSHVIMAMFHNEAVARSAVRISFGPENAADEVEQAAKIIAECVKELREIG